MKLIRHPDASTFISSAGEFLYREEESHSLMLGVAVTLQKDPGHYGTVPWFASVEDGGAVVAGAMRTPPYNLLVSGGPAHAMAMLVGDAINSTSPFPGVYGPKEVSLASASAWSSISSRRYHLKSADRIHRLGAVAPVTPAGGRMRELAEREIPLFCSWLSELGKEAHVLADSRNGEETVRTRIAFHQAWVWDDGGPVGMASWGRETKNTACIYAVYTPLEKRGRGYATSLVAGLSRHLLNSGRKSCVLFTDLANPVSNSIYAKIGYTPVCDFDEYEFE